MSLVDTLLGRLTRQFDRTPGPVLALRLSYLTGQMTWAIADDVLTTAVVGGVGENLSVDLTQYTIGSLATFLAAQPGYVVPYLDVEHAALGAVALVEEVGDINTSNGDHIHLGSNPNWALFGAYASELTVARAAIKLAPLEMSTTTADGYWLDILGSYYAVPRELGEFDLVYGPRIATEVILPRENNTAIEVALEQATGQPATCTDAVVYGNPLPVFDGAIAFSGAPHFFNASAARIYNLFNVDIGYALTGRQAPSDYLAMVRRQIDRLRAAGTHLYNLTLGPSVMADAVARASDALVDVWTQTSAFVSAASVTSADFGIAEFALMLAGGALSRDSGLGDLTARAALSALFGGAGDMLARPVVKAQAQAALPGRGVLQALGSTVSRTNIATFSATGDFSATVQAQPGTALFFGTGAVVSSALVTKPATAVFTATSGLAVSAAVISTQAGAATLQAQGALQAISTGSTFISASFVGAGGLVASLGQQQTASVLFFGTGALADDARIVRPATAVFAANGGLSGAAFTTRTIAAAATFAGAGAWSNPFSAEMSAEFGGGPFATVTAAIKTGAATFAALAALSDPFSTEFSGEFGEGIKATVVVAPPGVQLASATLPATSSLTATPKMITVVQAAVAGAGGFTATISAQVGSAAFSATANATAAARVAKPATAVFVPVGNLAANADAISTWTGAAALQGQGGLQATPIGTTLVSATLTGSGTLSATLGEQVPASAALVAAAALTAVASVTTRGTAIFVPAGRLTAAAITSRVVLASATLQATASLSNPFSKELSNEFGGGPDASVTQQIKTGAATLVATASLSDPFSKEFGGEFGEGLQATRLPPGPGPQFATATVQAAAVLQAPAKMVAVASASVAGASGFVAIVGPQSASATVAGSASLSADTRVIRRSTAIFVPSGGLIANGAATRFVLATAILPGQGGLNGSTPWTSAFTADFGSAAGPDATKLP